MRRPTTPVTLRLDPATKESLEVVAFAQDRSESEVMRDAVHVHLERVIADPDFQEQFNAYEARVRELFGLVTAEEIAPSTPSE